MGTRALSWECDADHSLPLSLHGIYKNKFTTYILYDDREYDIHIGEARDHESYTTYIHKNLIPWLPSYTTPCSCKER
jgi:hypothetical protein